MSGGVDKRLRVRACVGLENGVVRVRDETVAWHARDKFVAVSVEPVA